MIILFCNTWGSKRMPEKVSYPLALTHLYSSCWPRKRVLTTNDPRGLRHCCEKVAESSQVLQSAADFLSAFTLFLQKQPRRAGELSRITAPQDVTVWTKMTARFSLIPPVIYMLNIAARELAWLSPAHPGGQQAWTQCYYCTTAVSSVKLKVSLIRSVPVFFHRSCTSVAFICPLQRLNVSEREVLLRFSSELSDVRAASESKCRVNQSQHAFFQRRNLKLQIKKKQNTTTAHFCGSTYNNFYF